MELILTFLGTLGGFEAVKWGITTWRNRRTDARKENAAAAAMELENNQQRTNWLEKRIEQRDLKIDTLYIELREAQSQYLQLLNEKQNIELLLKEATIRRCNVRGCTNREPPSDF